MTQEIKETVGYALAQVCKAHRYAVDTALRRHNLRAGQEMILLQLWADEGLTQSQLVERLGVEPPTITKMLQRMEAEDLIERRPDPEDARISRVYLKPCSRALEQTVAASWREVEDQLTAGLSAEERMLLRRLLIQLRQNMENGERRA